jgi:hypothetical protein
MTESKPENSMSLGLYHCKSLSWSLGISLASRRLLCTPINAVTIMVSLGGWEIRPYGLVAVDPAYFCTLAASIDLKYIRCSGPSKNPF